MLLYLFSEASSLKTDLRNVFSATSWSYRPLGLPIVAFMAEISIKTQKCYVNEQNMSKTPANGPLREQSPNMGEIVVI